MAPYFNFFINFSFSVSSSKILSLKSYTSPVFSFAPFTFFPPFPFSYFSITSSAFAIALFILLIVGLFIRLFTADGV